VLVGWVDVMWDVGCVFGIIGVWYCDDMVEIVMYCVEVYVIELCKFEVVYGESFEDDFVCCDFMINVMVLSLL